MAPSRQRPARVEDIAALAPPSLRPVLADLCAIILSVHPSANVLCWPKLRIASFGIGPKKSTQHYAYIAVNRQHLNLGLYRGATLPNCGLEVVGTGKNLRHVKVIAPTAGERKAIVRTIEAALAEVRRTAPGDASMTAVGGKA